jgi:hypothetical protein
MAPPQWPAGGIRTVIPRRRRPKPATPSTWRTSSGYFDAATNDALLARFARAVVRGGRLVVELRNPAQLARLVELPGGTSAIVVERERDLMVDQVTYDPAERRSRTERFIVRGWTCSKARGNRFPIVEAS